MRLAWHIVGVTVLCLAKHAAAQTKPPRVLLQILHCVKTDKTADTSLKKDNTLTVSFTHYAGTEPNAEGFVLVIYESPSKGEVLDYVREFDHGKVRFYLVNNASFSVNQKNVLSVNDALGGVWTQGHLKMRVKRAMQTMYSIPNKLSAPFQNVSCHYYWSAH
jgi:hypothetical protein